jgi:ribosome-associated heat shock protein Hsp15
VELESVNVSKARAKELYIDHTPPPTPEEIELRRMLRLSTPPRRSRGMGAPKKQERRRLRRLKEGEEP